MAPEEEDSEQEIEKQPLELEDLLELFREPEEPPKPGTNPMWLVLILIVLIGGCWLAVTGVQAFVKEMTELQGGPPREGKSAERAPAPGPVSDVAAAFRERAAKGMSKDEIRWIVEDFNKQALDDATSDLIRGDLAARIFVGKDGDPPEQSDFETLKRQTLDLAKRQREWLAAALADGLRLDATQKAELKTKLAAALASDAERFDRQERGYRRMYELLAKGEEPKEEELREFGEDFVWGAEPLGNMIAYFAVANPQIWLEEKDYAPWELCTLSPDQLGLTTHDQALREQEQWLARDKTEDLLPPKAPSWPGASLQGSSPYERPKAAAVFPFVDGQKERLAQGGGLDFYRGLHPAQLKILLLLHPLAAANLAAMVEAKGD